MRASATPLPVKPRSTLVLPTALLTLMMLSFVSYEAKAFSINSFGPEVYTGDTAIMDASIGISDLIIEDFEDTQLIPGLSIAWGSNSPVTTIQEVVSFAGVSEWDGSFILDNRLNNNGLNPPEQTVTFYLEPGVTTFGFGLGQAEAFRNPSPRVLVNGNEVIGNIGELPGYVDSQLEINTSGNDRNLYLVIEAELNEIIHSVQLDLGSPTSAGMDGIQFDHIAISPIPEPNTALLSETFDVDTNDIPFDYPPFTFDPQGNPANTYQNSSPPTDASAFVQDGIIHLARAGTTNSTPYAEPRLTLTSGDLWGTPHFPDDFTISVELGGTPGNASWWAAALQFGDGVHYDLQYGFAPGGNYGTSFQVCARTKNTAEMNCQSTSASGAMGSQFNRLHPVSLRIQALPSGGYTFDITLTDSVSGITYEDVVSHPYPYPIRQVHLEREGTGGGDALFDNLLITSPIATTCASPGSFTPSTASLATTQDNYCEDWFGISQPGENLQDALLTWTDLTNANFAGSLLFNVDFTNALLTNASLFNARFEGAIVSSADLTGADLSFATLTGASYDENTVFPSGNTYETAPSGLDGDQRPWEAGMIPVPEPGFGIVLLVGVGMLAAVSARRVIH